MSNEDVVWFRSRRGPKANHFIDWQSYATAVVGSEGEPTLYNIVKTATRRGRTNRRKDKWRRLSAEVPWVTFVLGSGCLMASDVASLPGAEIDLNVLLSSNLKPVERTFPGLGLAVQAVEFVELLTIQRTGRGDVASALASIRLRRNISPADYSARVALAAALATRLYSAALASGLHVIGPADRDTVDLSAGSWWGAAIEEEIIRPLKYVLEELKEPGPTAMDAQRALAQLVSAMSSLLPGAPGIRKVRRAHVELLTAFAWYFLTEGTTVYPGWSELLLFRAFEDQEWFAREAVLSANPNPRPRLQNVVIQAKWVRDRIVEVTNLSWEARLAGGSSHRGRFYDLVATFLHQQAVARDSMPIEGPGAPPLPVCLVSSFDLELEMALWQRGEPFVVILPVFAQDSSRGDDSASLHWVWTEISPGDDVRSDSAEAALPLKLPDGLVKPGGWRKLPGGKSTPAEFLNGKPIVLRLTGSPLMQSPDVADAVLAGEGMTLSHALLLDEYTAIHQSALDFQQKGLPLWVTDVAATSSAPRFWMLLGTQLADSGIRFRLMSQQVASRYRENQKPSPQAKAPSAESNPEDHDGNGSVGVTTDVVDPSERERDWEQGRIGVLINERSQTNDRDLFLWHDFDVVDGTLGEALRSDLKALHEALRVDFSEIAAANPESGDAAQAANGGGR